MTDTLQAAPTGSDPVFFSELDLRFAEGGPMAFIERFVSVPGVEEPLRFGVRGPWHPTYHTSPGDFPERATTSDGLVAAVAACLAGTFGGMLTPRRIDLDGGNCAVAVRGEMGPPDEGTGGHIVRSVHVVFRLTGFDDPKQQATIERVHDLLHGECWLSQTLVGSRCRVTSAVEHVAG